MQWRSCSQHMLPLQGKSRLLRTSHSSETCSHASEDCGDKARSVERGLGRLNIPGTFRVSKEKWYPTHPGTCFCAIATVSLKHSSAYRKRHITLVIPLQYLQTIFQGSDWLYPKRWKTNFPSFQSHYSNTRVDQTIEVWMIEVCSHRSYYAYVIGNPIQQFLMTVSENSLYDFFSQLQDFLVSGKGLDSSWFKSHDKTWRANITIVRIGTFPKSPMSKQNAP